MKLMYPDFKNSLINLASSIKLRFGKNYSYPTLSVVDDAIKDKKHVVVMLLDGLGMNILEKNLSVDSFLRRHLVTEITSVFPPTTVAATNVVLQGKLPGATGWFGWNQYFKTLNRNVVMFTNRDYFTNEKINEVEKNKHVLYHEFGYDLNCEYETLFPSFRVGGYATLKEMLNKALSICNTDAETYTYCYWENPDALAHEFGCYSANVKNELIKIDKELELFASKKNDDTQVIVIADHGLVDVKWFDLKDYPDLTSLLSVPASNEPRSIIFQVKDKNRFKAQFLAHFCEYFDLYSKDEFLELGLCGNDTHMVEEFLGDFIAISKGPYAISLNGDTNLVAHHAGMTDLEMRIPLIMF